MNRVSPGTYLTDGVKSIPLSELRPDAWTPVDPLEQSAAGTQSATKLAGSVPVLYRCIDIRANAVAGVPYRLEKGGKAQDGPEIDKLRETLHSMLWLAETGLCFKAAYWELGTNRVGKNLTPFWLSPWSVTPLIDQQRGLYGFMRSGVRGVGALEPDQILYIWNPDPAVEVGPGRAPVEVVLGAAGLLWALDAYARAFFARGGTKITLLSVPPTTSSGEREKIKTWWNMVTQGIRNAWGSTVLNAEVKPTVLGSDPKDTAAPELSKLSREDVMVGMGVPQSLAFSNPLAGGTVDAERLNFYDFTVLPRLQIIWPPINEKYLAKLGYRAIPEPEKLEVYQASELRKATGLMAVTGEPFYLPDEARTQMGKEPKAIAQQKLDIAIKEQRKAEGLPEPPPEPTTPEAGSMPGEPAPVDPATLPPAELPETEEAVKRAPLHILDLQRWEAKALKKPGKAVTFSPDALSPEDAAWIRAGLEGASSAEIKALFDSMKKAPGDDLDERERVLYEKVRKVLARYGDDTAAAIVRGETPSLDGLAPPLRAALLADLTAVALEVMGTLADTIGPDFDPATMGGKAAEWARSYTYDLVRGLTDTTRATVQQAVGSFFQGMSSKDVAVLLSPAFGDRRADVIASTEITRAASQATVMYQQHLKAAGLDYELQWQTANDEHTCAICTPRNGAVQGDGWDTPPPGHPRCRCRVSLARAK